eukprot:m.179786 g.179786  ORF g.179786 m.179786 type:complete len:638 (-) comp14857_c0_seq1:190-2103(-)
MLPVGRLATGAGTDDEDDFEEALQGIEEGPVDAFESETGADADVQKRFSLSVVEYLHSLQSQHGLRHDNFERYRRYCTSRLARLRLVLKFKNGTRRGYAKREITREIVTDERFLHILLLLTDRAWAYYMQLKHESSGDDRKRHHMLARIVKAAKYAKQLADVVGTEGELCDERSELEVTAYTLWITALMKRETKEHQEAIKLFGNAKAIYDRLGGVCSEHCRSLYLKRVEEIDSQIRYCTFMTGGSAADIDELLAASATDELDLLKEKFARVIEAQKNAKSGDLSTIEWLGKTEGVQSEAIAMGLLKIQKKETAVTADESGDVDRDAWMTAYDELLGAYAELMTTVSEEIVAERKAPAPSTDKILNRGFVLDYLTYHKLEHTVARTLRMATEAMDELSHTNTEGGSNSLVTNVARLFDIAVQNLDSMSEISATQEHAGFCKRLAARKCVFRGFRCALLAEGHLAEGRVRESVVLLDRSDELVGLAQADLSESAGQETPEDLSLLKALQQRVRRQRCQQRAQAYILQNPDVVTAATSGSGGAASTTNDGDGAEDAIVRDQLSSFEVGTRAARGEGKLTSFPPQFEAVPPKPLFFDLASSAVEFDVAAIDRRAMAPETASALGTVTGAIGNLFGWGGSA